MDHLPGEWQYKVMRGCFYSRDAIESLIDEQSQWGWQLVEVMNPYQIRLGRSNQQALKDVAREGNPYATTRRACQKINKVGVVMILTIMALLIIELNAVRLLRPSPAAPAPPVLFSPRPESSREFEITPAKVVIERHQTED